MTGSSPDTDSQSEHPWTAQLAQHLSHLAPGLPPVLVTVASQEPRLGAQASIAAGPKELSAEELLRCSQAQLDDLNNLASRQQPPEGKAPITMSTTHIPPRHLLAPALQSAIPTAVAAVLTESLAGSPLPIFGAAAMAAAAAAALAWTGYRTLQWSHQGARAVRDILHHLQSFQPQSPPPDRDVYCLLMSQGAPRMALRTQALPRAETAPAGETPETPGA